MINSKSKFAVVTDFDGTITTRDMGDAICLHFGAADRRDIELSSVPGECVKHWMTKLFHKLKQNPGEVHRFVLKTAKARPGFAQAARALSKAGIPFEIASGGLNLYIEPLLDKWKTGKIKIFCGKAVFGKNGYIVRYPWKMKVDEMKASRVRYYQKQGRRVVFCGDASSDFKAAKTADIVFAHGKLMKMCREAGIKTAPLKNFADVKRAAGI